MVAFVLGAVSLVGCAGSAPSRPSAFTHDWVRAGGQPPRRTAGDDDEDNSKRGDRRAVLYRDEEGRTRVGISDADGLGADVDTDGRSPFVRFGYQVRFGGDNRREEEEAPSTPDQSSDTD